MEAHVTPVSGRTVPRFIRQRRWWAVLLVLWAVAVGLYTHLHLAQLREQMTQVALAGARNMFRMVILTRNWNASHGGIYVPVNRRVEPNPYLAIVIACRSTTIDEFDVSRILIQGNLRLAKKDFQPIKCDREAP